MIYPSLQEVDTASHLEICRWMRFLTTPVNPLEVEVMERLIDRFDDFGGMTPAISKQIGWADC